jgi:hypothetical protein
MVLVRAQGGQDDGWSVQRGASAVNRRVAAVGAQPNSVQAMSARFGLRVPWMDGG